MPDSIDAADGGQKSLPQPLQEVVSLLDTATQVGEILEQVSQKLNAVLLSSGVREVTIQKNTAALSASHDIGDLRERVVSAYEQSMSPSDTAHNSFSIAPRMHDDLQVRTALSALRESPDFETLKEEQIWDLPVFELKTKLETTHYREKCHWYMIIIRIMRFREPTAVTGGVIAAAPLRHFLCDYVFGVPRPEFTDKRRTREPSGASIIRTESTGGKKRVFEFGRGERPKFDGIPEEQTQTYEDLLAWLRIPENADLVTSLEETVRLTKLKHGAYSPAQLAPKIIEKFRQGYLGHAVLSLAYFLKPEVLVQDFIAAIRPKEVPKPKIIPPLAPVSQSTPIQPPPRKPIPAPSSLRPLVVLAKPTAPSTGQAVPTPVSHGPICPTFEVKSDALIWLREQNVFEGLIRKAAKEKDERNISAFLVRNEGSLLLRILFKIKENCDLESIADIVHHVFPEEIRQSESAPVVSSAPPEEEVALPVPEVSLQDQYLQKTIEIQGNATWMTILRPIVEAHKAGRFDEAIEMYNAFHTEEENQNSVNAWYALAELQEFKKALGVEGVRIFDLIFEVCECEFKKGDKSPEDKTRAELLNIYSNEDLSWKNRMSILIIESGCSAEEFGRIIGLDSSSQIFDALRLFKLKVPLEEKTWKLWQEKMAEETDLACFFEKLVLLDHTGEKRKGSDQPIELHELRRKMRHIKFPKPAAE